MTSGDRARSLIAVLLIGLLAHAPTAQAQSADAEALFRQARRLLLDGQVEEACLKLEASQRLDSSVGTLLNLGDCRERLGKLATAWAHFRAAESLARREHNDEAEAEARRRAHRLEPRLSHLLIEVPDEVRVDGLTVSRDDTPVDPGLWNTKVPVDPGSYQIAAAAPGRLGWSHTVFITSRDREQMIAVPMLSVEPDEPETPKVWPPPPRNRNRSLTTTRKLSIAVGALGASVLGAGLVVGLRARDLDEAANERCPATLCADPEALRLNDEAHQQADRANLLYAAGGVAVGAALVMWLLGGHDDVVSDADPRGSKVLIRPTVTDRNLGFAVAGRF